MSAVTFEEVVRLAEQLRPTEQEALIEHLRLITRQRKLTGEERKALFATLVTDLGPVSQDYSDRRVDWYDDDER